MIFSYNDFSWTSNSFQSLKFRRRTRTWTCFLDEGSWRTFLCSAKVLRTPTMLSLISDSRKFLHPGHDTSNVSDSFKLINVDFLRLNQSGDMPHGTLTSGDHKSFLFDLISNYRKFLRIVKSWFSESINLSGDK